MTTRKQTQKPNSIINDMPKDLREKNVPVKQKTKRFNDSFTKKQNKTKPCKDKKCKFNK